MVCIYSEDSFPPPSSFSSYPFPHTLYAVPKLVPASKIKFQKSWNPVKERYIKVCHVHIYYPTFITRALIS